ncbi:MAG: DUF2802 domain-containing protein [Bdellovibrio sp.]|nr:MAG: DUF2802 domain-containing protein [Bdellovibrio sp.]
MSGWVLAQIAVNVIFLLGFIVLWVKLRRPPQEDPRLSRGLQLLQSKISILEDLSDRTDKQVHQLNQLLEKKAAIVQEKITEAKKQVHTLERSMDKSIEVAEIFQEKIPHEEIVERQQTVKYVKAAQLAHAGLSVDEILEKVDLSRGEVEFIVSVNKEELAFDEEHLPRWIQKAKALREDNKEAQSGQEELVFIEPKTPLTSEETEKMFTSEPPLAQEMDSLKRVGEEFKKACEEFEKKQEKMEKESQIISEATQKIMNKAKDVTHKIVDSAEGAVQTAGKAMLNVGQQLMKETPEALKPISGSLKKTTEENVKKTSRRYIPTRLKKDPPIVEKVEFPRIDINDNLS